MLTLPDGRQRWPYFGYQRWMEELPVEQLQLIQRSLHEIEVRFVARQALSPAQTEALERIVREALEGDFTLALVPVAEIPRSASGKFEDFISELPFARPSA